MNVYDLVAETLIDKTPTQIAKMINYAVQKEYGPDAPIHVSPK